MRRSILLMLAFCSILSFGMEPPKPGEKRDPKREAELAEMFSKDPSCGNQAKKPLEGLTHSELEGVLDQVTGDLPKKSDLLEASALNLFSVPFFARQYSLQPKKNLAVSPFSARAAAQMVYLGARQATKKQLGQALVFHRDLTDQEIVDHYTRFERELTRQTQGDDATQLKVANAVVVNQRFKLQPEYQAMVSQMRALVSSGNFSSGEALNQVNQWAANNTNGKITNLLSELSEDDRIVLLNAIWAKGSWTFPFDLEDETETFTTVEGNKTSVTMLKHQPYEGLPFKHYVDEDVEAVSMPVKDGAVEFTILLPSQGYDFRAFAGNLTEDRVRGVFRKMKTELCVVEMPKFRIENTLDLIPNLDQVAPLVFSGRADLSGMLANNNEPIRITKAVQKTYVDVNRFGFEAAAATAMVGGLESMPPQPKYKFRADRPFVFLITKASTRHELLFIGSYVGIDKD
ncbi:MAG: serpin family protein [Bacteriovoracia bacterium]